MVRSFSSVLIESLYTFATVAECPLVGLAVLWCYSFGRERGRSGAVSTTYAHGNRRGDEGFLSNNMYHVVSVLPVSMIDISRGGVPVFYTPRANPNRTSK